MVSGLFVKPLLQARILLISKFMKHAEVEIIALLLDNIYLKFGQ